MKKSQNFHYNYPKIAGVHWFVYSDFHNFVSIGGFAPRTPYKCKFPNFLNFYPHFRQKFDKILKKILKKSRNFLEIFLKIVIFHWFFYSFFENFSGVRGALPPGTPHAATPLQALPWWTSLPPQKKNSRVR